MKMKIEKAERIVFGSLLGSGGFKECYSLPRNSKQVALKFLCSDYMRDNKCRKQANHEVKCLERLKSLGFPVARTYKILITPTDTILIQKRYLKTYGGHWDLLKSKESKIKSFKSLKKIKKAAENNKCGVGDLQFLIDSKGTIVVADPLSTGRHELQNTITTLEDMIEDVYFKIKP
jgi:hypothetical protein